MFITVPNVVTGLAIQSRTTTSLTVKWNTPPGGKSGYRVTLDDGSESTKTETPDKTATSVEFTGLTAGTRYTVKVFTLSGTEESTKVEGKFYTSKSYEFV